MQTGQPSRTARAAAVHRAVHQVLEKGRIFADPLALRILGEDAAALVRDAQQNPHRRRMRIFIAARTRFAEDALGGALARGVRQFVVLGAGLDTFAYRNPFPSLRVFEVDFPATQEWKHAMLAEAAITSPANLTFVPLDFEHKALAEGLAEAGFDAGRPAYFGWLGVVPYLTLDAFRATLSAIAQLPAGTAVSFDYAIAPETLSPRGRMAFDALARRVASAGEPFQLFFTPQTLEAELRRAGFHRIEQLDSDHLNELYFKDRADGLKLSAVKLGMLVTAWM